jgi:adenylate cyclase
MMKALPAWLRTPLAVGLIAGSLVSVGILTLRATGGLETLELATYDWLIRSRPSKAIPDPRITLVAVTEQDIRRYGQWPLSDQTMAELLGKLVQLKPRAIGVDIYRDIPVPPGREALDAVLTANRSIVVVAKIGDETKVGIPGPPSLNGTDQIGFNDILVDADGIVRRGLMFQDAGDRVEYAFAVRLALRYLEVDGIAPVPDPLVPEHIRLGSVTLRPFESSDGGYAEGDASGYQILLDYLHGRVLPHAVSIEDVMANRVHPAAIEGKVVMVGVTAESVPDVFHTPFSSGFKSGHIMSGVALHGQLVSQLLRAGLAGHHPIRTVGDATEVGWIIAWGLLGGLLGLWTRSSWRLTVGLIAGLVVLVGIVAVVFWRGWWIPLVPPALTWVCAASLVTAAALNMEKAHRALLMQLFSRHVSSTVAETIWEQREQFLDGGRPRPQKMTATVMFSDLAGYTAASEKLDPQALMDWINSYMEAMAQLVIDHNGVIDDYAGDGIKSDFGVPIPRSDERGIAEDAANAVRCALAMERRLHQLNEHWQAQNLPTAGMRIGICTGPVVAGSIGDAQRLKYTTVGDTVNSAARLEHIDRDRAPGAEPASPCRILIEESTVRRLDGRFQTAFVGEFKVKGKDQPLMAYRVQSEASALPKDLTTQEGAS